MLTLFPFYKGMRAQALWNVGRRDEALATIREAHADAVKNDEHWCEPELHRIEGSFLEQLGDSRWGEAEQSYATALSSSRQLEAKSLELRAATSMAQLQSNQGRHAEARALLGPVVDWFTEGRTTQDMVRAQALLERLAAPSS